MSDTPFRTTEPKPLYFGTPVALTSSLDEDGTTNLAPMFSLWALGWTIVLGILDDTKTRENLSRHAECVVSLPSPEMWEQVGSLAPLTGKGSGAGGRGEAAPLREIQIFSRRTLDLPLSMSPGSCGHPGQSRRHGKYGHPAGNSGKGLDGAPDPGRLR